MATRTIYVDMSNLAHRIFNTHLNELKNGIIYGSLRSLMHIEKWSRDRWPDDMLKIVLCYDASNSHRRSIDSEYKGNRKYDDKFKDLFRQTDELSKIVNYLGLSIAKAEGYECDDVMALFANRSSVNNKAMLFTHDKDMYQCLSASAYVVQNLPRVGLYVYSQNDLFVDFGCDPHMWTTIQAVVGDGVDNIPGLHGVGVHTVVKYLDGILKRGKKYDAIAEFMNSDRFRTNLELVTFPASGIEDFDYAQGKYSTLSEIDTETWNDACLAYGMQSLKRKSDSNNQSSQSERFEL